MVSVCGEPCYAVHCILDRMIRPLSSRPFPLRWSATLAAAAGLTLSAWPAGPAVAQGSSARFMSAGELHLRLSAGEPAAREAGRHYVLGVVDALTLARDPRSCIGPGVAASQLVDVVAAQLQARPDLHRFNAASLVREAIATAFPCV
jgi:hypothetical protein